MLVSDTRKGYEHTKEKIITVFYAKEKIKASHTKEKEKIITVFYAKKGKQAS